MKKFFIVTIIILVCFAAVSGIFIGVAARFALFDIFMSLTPAAQFTQESNILVMGVDSAGGVRSDTIMVLHVNPAKKEASVLSIPRDTIVTIPDRGLDKINHAFAYGGVDLSRRTIENFLNVSIPYYITIDLSGIQELIDKIGGIDVDVGKRMYYVDYAGYLSI
ncbi:MAG: LCP family protein, partial [Candidatus Margulisbacteria bacterium]|nr:LCP family protein [Candidatus Margulisiibacteriota bacterium]